MIHRLGIGYRKGDFLEHSLKVFGLVIQQKRKSLNLSLAVVTKDIGCTIPALHYMEKAKRKFSRSLYRRVCDYYKIPYLDLFQLLDSPIAKSKLNSKFRGKNRRAVYATYDYDLFIEFLFRAFFHEIESSVPGFKKIYTSLNRESCFSLQENLRGILRKRLKLFFTTRKLPVRRRLWLGR